MVITLTQYSGAILGPIAKLLGLLMNGIFNVLDMVGIPNIGLSIILFTFVIYLLMIPLTIKQQKFSKLSAKMNPELQAITAKYKGKKDNDSMMRMNQETKALYEKYGTSPTGSCLPLLIQMPILLALYRVISNMPAYVTQVKESFTPFVDKLIAQPGSSEFIQTFRDASYFKGQFSNDLFVNGDTEFVRNTFIDVLNRASSAEWTSLGDKFPSLAGDISNTLVNLNEYNNFLGMNIANSPSFIVREAISTGAFILIAGALLVPLLAALTQWLNTKLMPQPQSAASNADSTMNTMESSMKTMNVMMPVMSAVFCYTLPAGMGIYWIAGAVVRSIQQIVINKHIDKMDFDEVIKKNIEKVNKKREKAGLPPQSVSNNAKIHTKSMNTSKTQLSQAEKEAAIAKSTEFYSKNAKPGSIAAKANMVKQYNEKNNK